MVLCIILDQLYHIVSWWHRHAQVIHVARLLADQRLSLIMSSILRTYLDYHMVRDKLRVHFKEQLHCFVEPERILGHIVGECVLSLVRTKHIVIVERLFFS